MSPNEIERLLASEPMIEPGEGFARSVMDAVVAEASAPQPLAFPWRRALPGIVLAGAGFCTGVTLLVLELASAPAMGDGAAWGVPAWITPDRLWGALVLAASLATILYFTRESRPEADPSL